MSYLGWRWTECITAIMGFFGLALCLLFLEETYPPIILVQKAADLRRRTKNWGRYARHEHSWALLTMPNHCRNPRQARRDRGRFPRTGRKELEPALTHASL